MTAEEIVEKDREALYIGNTRTGSDHVRRRGGGALL